MSDRAGDAGIALAQQQARERVRAYFTPAVSGERWEQMTREAAKRLDRAPGCVPTHAFVVEVMGAMVAKIGKMHARLAAVRFFSRAWKLNAKRWKNVALVADDARKRERSGRRELRDALRLAASRPTPYGGMWHADDHYDPNGGCVGCRIEAALGAPMGALHGGRWA